jgi:hypothetical protein
MSPTFESVRSDLERHALTMSAILKSILGGQLKLREHGRLLCAVVIEQNASGGKIGWGTTNPYCSYRSSDRGRIVPDLHYTSSFIVEDGGARLQICKREVPLALLNLPCSLLERIISMVVHPLEGVRIDLDKETKFNCGMIHVNRDIYR